MKKQIVVLSALVAVFAFIALRRPTNGPTQSLKPVREVEAPREIVVPAPLENNQQSVSKTSESPKAGSKHRKGIVEIDETQLEVAEDIFGDERTFFRKKLGLSEEEIAIIDDYDQETKMKLSGLSVTTQSNLLKRDRMKEREQLIHALAVQTKNHTGSMFPELGKFLSQNN